MAGFAFFFILLSLALPAHAQEADRCDAFPDVPVHITPVFDEPRYDFTHTIGALQALSSDGSHSIPHYHSVTMGLTRYEPVLEFRMPLVVTTAPDGLEACASVQHVDVTVGYRDVTVFIASEIPPGGCGFDETLGHEEKHIAVNRELLNEFVPLIEDRFKAYLRLNGMFRVSNATYAEQLLRQKLGAIMDDMINQMQAENSRRQRAVDSRDEYARLAHVCNGDLARIAAHFRQTGN